MIALIAFANSVDKAAVLAQAGIEPRLNSHDGVTMAFLTLSMAEVFQAFNMRSRRGSLFKLKKQNLYLWGAGVAAPCARLREQS